jgi:hypothetical protein
VKRLLAYADLFPDTQCPLPMLLAELVQLLQRPCIREIPHARSLGGIPDFTRRDFEKGSPLRRRQSIVLTASTREINQSPPSRLNLNFSSST